MIRRRFVFPAVAAAWLGPAPCSWPWLRLSLAAARPGRVQALRQLSSTVPAASALVLPAPGTLSIVSVIQRQYTNAIEQQIALSTSAATSGQNFISIQAFGPAETVAMPSGALAFRPVRHSAIQSEIRTYFPGHAGW